MLRQAAALSYAVRLRVVLKYFGYLCGLLTVLTLVPLGVSVWSGETHLSGRYAIVTGVLAVLGGLLSRLSAPARVQANEGMVLVALTFLFTPLIMSYPMLAFGPSFIDMFFEAVSGATTTGLSTLTSVENAPTTFLFARSWMQWYGGLGIMAMSLALVAQPSLVTEGLGVTEAESDDLVGSTKAHMRRVLAVYSLLTIIGLASLGLIGVPLFQAVQYTFAAVSTGGFAPHDASLAGLQSATSQISVTALCLLGAIPFTWYHRLSRRQARQSLSLLEPTAIVVSGIVLTIVLGLSMGANQTVSWNQAWYHAPLLAFSAQTTAGFATMDLAELDAFSKLAMIPAMAIGGGIGSTSGGFKILRLLILLRLLQTVIVRTSLPKQAVLDTQLQQRRLGDKEIHDALLLIGLFVIVVIVSWAPFVALGYDPLDSLFEVVSATGTVGLSVGITSIELPTLLKGVLCIDMLLGRLEMLAWLVFVYPGTWLGRRREEA